jgi:hypothetical protein
VAVEVLVVAVVVTVDARLLCPGVSAVDVGAALEGGTVTVVVALTSAVVVVVDVDVAEATGEAQAGRVNVVVMPFVMDTTVYCAAMKGRMKRGEKLRSCMIDDWWFIQPATITHREE